MFIVYDFIFLIFSLIYLPLLILRKKIHRGIWLRAGLSVLRDRTDRPIWLHAVSVGETMAIRNLFKSLKQEYPSQRFVISTVTPTGNKIAKSFAQDTDSVIYLPLDLSWVVRKFIRKINPSLFIITETELWPNLLTSLSRAKVKIVVVNGRISDRSFRGYRLVKFLLKPILEKIDLYCVQSNLDLQRLTSLGVSPAKVKVTGNMKFDSINQEDFKKERLQLRDKLRLTPDDKLWLSGSTHEGEEKIILDVYRKLLTDYPNLKLLLVPRHPQRAGEIEREIIRFGFRPLSLSQYNAEDNRLLADNLIFILDTIGELRDYFSIAEFVFMGGSLVKIGGHNLLEPAGFAKPIIFGPYMFNFRDIAKSFLDNQAAIMVNDSRQLRDALIVLLNDSLKARDLGQRARQLVLQNQGSTLKNIEWIKSIFSGT